MRFLVIIDSNFSEDELRIEIESVLKGGDTLEEVANEETGEIYYTRSG